MTGPPPRSFRRSSSAAGGTSDGKGGAQSSSPAAGFSVTSTSSVPPAERGPELGPPWDLPVDEASFAFVDLEMTGLDSAVDRVIEICIVRKRGDHLEDSLETLVNPGPAATWQTDVHGLTPAAIEHAPAFAAVAPRILELLGGAVLVAHAAFWDVTFLEAEFARLGTKLDCPFYLDTLTLARRAFRADRYSLDALTEKLGIVRGVAHRAGSDVRALCAVFDRVKAELAPRSPRDLWHVRIAEHHARPDIVAACVALAGTGEPGWITYRPRHKTARSFQVVIHEVRTDLDPPRVLGYSLHDRGRFDLRTDRILSIARSSPAGSLPPTS